MLTLIKKLISYLFATEVSAASYAVVFRVGFAIMGGAIFAVIASWHVQRDLNQRLERQINEVNDRFAQMGVEHDRAVHAADAAIKARDDIYAKFCRRAVDMENALKASPEFDGLLLPDSARPLINGDRAAGAPAPGASSGGFVFRDSNPAEGSN